MNDIRASNIELRVLALCPTHKDFELTSGILQRAGIESACCSSLAELSQKMAEGAGAALVVEEALGSAGNDELSRSLANQPSWSDIPILVLSRTGEDPTRVAAAMERLGTVTVLERPVGVAALVSAVRTALNARRRQYQVREHAKALEAARDELEDRVAERTSELAEVTRSLERQNAERQKAQQERLVLLQKILTAQEDERRRISRDMHDQFGQQLTALRLNLESIQSSPGLADDLKARLLKTQQLAESLDSEVNFLVWELRPTALDVLGLKVALEDYVRRWSEQFGIAADFHAAVFDDRVLSDIAATNLYRITQEALNNTAKHAKAAKASVVIEKRGSNVILILEDDGRGFNPKTQKRKGLGLKGMRERAELIEGSMEIESRRGSGTTIYVTVPTPAKA